MRPDYVAFAHELYPQISAGSVPISDACDILSKALQNAYDAGMKRASRICSERYMGDNNREDMEARRCANAIINAVDSL